MKQIALVIFILLVLFQTAQSVDNDCLYDQASQKELLQNIATKKSRSKVDLIKRSVVWVENNKTEWTVQYGGCHHLVFIVTRSKIQKVRSSQAEVFRIAIRLAKEYWHKSDSEDLEKAIIEGAVEKNVKPRKTYYQLKHSYYDDFVVIQEFKDKREQISIKWLRTF